MELDCALHPELEQQLLTWTHMLLQSKRRELTVTTGDTPLMAVFA